jgi:hypothetical protein
MMHAWGGTQRTLHAWRGTSTLGTGGLLLLHSPKRLKAFLKADSRDFTKAAKAL